MELKHIIGFARQLDKKAFRQSWHPEKLIAKLQADEDFTWTNDHYWVKSDGEFGSTKPRFLGPRGMHSSTDGRPLSFKGNYGFWPRDKMIHVRTREDAIRLSASIVLYNAMCSFSKLSIYANSEW